MSGSFVKIARWAVLAVLTGGVAATSARAACLSPSVAEAFKGHALRTELMVGALSCGLDGAYDRFVLRHRGELSRQNRLLADALDPAGGGALDALFTQLANDVSRRSVGEGVEACARWDALFRAAEGVEANQELSGVVKTAEKGGLWHVPDAAAWIGLARCPG